MGFTEDYFKGDLFHTHKGTDVILSDGRTIESVAIRDKGYFATLAALTTAYPVGTDGDYARVGTTDTVWIWDSDANTWKDGGVSLLEVTKTSLAGSDNTIQISDGLTRKIKDATGLTWVVATNTLGLAASSIISDAGLLTIQTTSNANIALSPNGTGIVTISSAIASGAGMLKLTNSASSSSTAGATMDLICNDGAAMASGDRLGGYRFYGAYDGTSNLALGASIVALTEGAYSSTTNAPTSLTFNLQGTSGSITEYMRLTSSGNLGLGVIPATSLDIVNSAKTAGTNYIRNTVYNNDADPPYFIGRYSRGTAASVLPIQSGDVFGGFLFQGNKGTGTASWTYGGGLFFEAIAAPSTTINTGVRILVGNSTGVENSFYTEAGKIGVGAFSITTRPTYNISLLGTAAKTIGMERNTTANTRGLSCTIYGGSGATSGSTDKGSDGLNIYPCNATTGMGETQIALYRYNRAATTSTSDNTATQGIILPSLKNLTDNVTVPLFDHALPSGSTCGGFITYTIHCSDGTDYQVHSGLMNWAALNKAGTITSNFGHVSSTSGLELDVVSAGTLADTFSITNGTGKITININANSSLTPTILYIEYTIHNESKQTITQL